MKYLEYKTYKLYKKIDQGNHLQEKMRDFASTFPKRSKKEWRQREKKQRVYLNENT